MKKLLYFSAVVTLAALPLITLAASVQPAQELQHGTTLKQEIGTVSARGDILDDLDAKLGAAATKEGASAYTITSVNENDGGVYGTAILYK